MTTNFLKVMHMTTNLPTLTCDADTDITRASIDEAMHGKSELEQRNIVSAWFSHLRSITGNADIRESGITYTPTVTGRMEPQAPQHTLEGNKALLANHLSSLCAER